MKRKMNKKEYEQWKKDARFALKGYDYDSNGSRFYKRVCRDFYMYDPMTIKDNDHSLFVKLGTLFTVLNYPVLFLLTGFICWIFLQKTFFLSLVFSVLACFFYFCIITAEDFVGEYACKAQCFFTASWIGYLIQLIAFKCATFEKLKESPHFFKMFFIYIGLAALFYIIYDSYWKSFSWYQSNFYKIFYRWNRFFQKRRKRYIEKTEKMLKENGSTETVYKHVSSI